MHKRSGTLKAVPPFDLRRSLDFIGGFGPLAGEQRVAGEEGGGLTLTKAIMVDGSPVLFRVGGAGRDPDGAPSRTEVRYELFSEEELPGQVAERVAGRISFILSLDDDIRPFYAIAEKDLPFHPLVERLWGLHHVKFPSLLEISCWAILNQRVQMPLAKRMKQALVERFGASVSFEGSTYWAFPDYERMKKATPRELLEATRNQRSAVRLGSLLENFEDLDERFLRTALYEKAEERLRRVNGIGEWAAQFILFRGLGRVERLRYNMKPVERMLQELYGPGKTLDDVNHQYGQWCGYWSLYMWGSGMAERLSKEEKEKEKKKEGEEEEEGAGSTS
ncbi:MAG: DNA-3-methyladenine glycosylase 2 family protein [Nitrososphaerales archaeon]